MIGQAMLSLVGSSPSNFILLSSSEIAETLRVKFTTATPVIHYKRSLLRDLQQYPQVNHSQYFFHSLFAYYFVADK